MPVLKGKPCLLQAGLWTVFPLGCFQKTLLKVLLCPLNCFSSLFWPDAPTQMEYLLRLWYKAFRTREMELHEDEIAHCGSLQKEVSSIRLWKSLGLKMVRAWDNV